MKIFVFVYFAISFVNFVLSVRMLEDCLRYRRGRKLTALGTTAVAVTFFTSSFLFYVFLRS